MAKKSSRFPDQLLSFFKRYSPKDSLEDTLPILGELYNQLQAGHASIELNPSWDHAVESLKKHLIIGSEKEKRPIILTDEGNLYFRRYHEYETKLARKLIYWASQQVDSIISINPKIVKCFNNAPDQLNAAKLAIQNNFAVITGGPGTGKTYLLVAILANLLKENPNLKISLVAPTGKAAQRMTESIQANIDFFSLTSEEKEIFPQHASTIHRLLKPLPPSIHFRKNEDSQLNSDFIIVDEASMVDLPLMSKLVEAIKPTSRLLLIGDVDQLAPVEAGAPLASIVRYFLLPNQPQLVAKLSTNRRFGKDSSINKLCSFISHGKTQEVLNLIDQGVKEDFEYYDETNTGDKDEKIKLGYSALAQAKTPAEAHKAFLKFQILCPTHEGENGVNSMNEKTQTLLKIKNETNNNSLRYPGMPIIIEKNDYGVNLYNGDIGIFLPDEKQNGQLVAWFMESDGSYRAISPARLPPYKLAYAMTIHRAQGSEYEQVMITLPNHHTELLSRHLLYVACSRARQKVTLIGSREIIESSINHFSPTSSGLQNRLLEARASIN
jgi:exodeoxyribonuclease V alpha subunit